MSAFAAAPSAGRWWLGGVLALAVLPAVGIAFVSPDAVAIGVAAGIPLVLGPLVLRLAGRETVYRVEGGELVVPAHFAEVRVPLAGATARRGKLDGAWRTAGTAVPGFYVGRFSDGAGFHAAATASERWFVTGGGRRVFVTPASPEGFLAALESAGAHVDRG